MVKPRSFLSLCDLCLPPAPTKRPSPPFFFLHPLNPKSFQFQSNPYFLSVSVMCGGAFIAGFIPRRDGQRVTASDIWPNSPLFDFNKCPPDHDASPVKRPLRSSGMISRPFFFFLILCNFRRFFASNF